MQGSTSYSEIPFLAATLSMHVPSTQMLGDDQHWQHWPASPKVFTVTHEIEIAQNWKRLSTTTGQC
jgi:hypothetical protein